MLESPFNQYILWEARLSSEGKVLKIPIDYRTLRAWDAHDPAIWMPKDFAVSMAELAGPKFGVAFVFTDSDPLFFLDVDHALLPDGTWSQTAQDMINLFPGAYVEVSQSKTGLHIIGVGTPPNHACKNIPLGLELYHTKHFVALTGYSCHGDAMAYDHTATLAQVVPYYFPYTGGDVEDENWTDAPVPEWAGPEDDDELVGRMLSSKPSAASAFVGKVTIQQLWSGDVDALSRSYPDTFGDRPYDPSSADSALAQHLAFWTGKNCERILGLMKRSALIRDKWERQDYMRRTIIRACANQKDVYHRAETPDISHLKPAPIKGSPAQITYAESIRSEKVMSSSNPPELAGMATTASFWIDNRDKPADELLELLRPNPAFGTAIEPTLIAGNQYLPVEQQLDLFKGCIYVRDQHEVMMPDRTFLDAARFNAFFGGFMFQLDELGKTTKKAFEAFTESQVARFPKVVSTVFRPELPAGGIVELEGNLYVNRYLPINTKKTPGDVTPFLIQIQKMLPDERDRNIFLGYMAAIVQYPGKKFQWATFLQGAEGNGKTFITKVMEYCVGEDYCFRPKPEELSEKFNSWVFDKLLVTIEEVYIPEHKSEIMEILKPVITNDRLSRRAMQKDQVMGDNRANFMFNSNHKDAIRKTDNDRRYCVFYSAQQTKEDLLRDGMTDAYFRNLYNWLYEGGYSYINFYLSTYPIPDEFNPLFVTRAPMTSSTREAVEASQGTVEQEVLEAIASGYPGFKNGWISSAALERLLEAKRRYLGPNTRKKLLADLGYIHHPSLPGGRAHSPIPFEDGKRPRLYVLKGHTSTKVENPTEVMGIYIKDQTEF